jgi:hypothetical protein
MGRRHATAAYWSTLSYMDHEVGRLLDGLEANQLEDDTIVLFLSDHGWSNGHHGRYGKGALFDWSSRVPLLVAAPGVTDSGTTCSQTVELIDVYPTVMELCGLATPTGVEGQSLVPLLQNPGAAFKPAFPMMYRAAFRSTAVVTGQYKFIHWESGLHQLYDLQADPLEYVNLFGDPSYDAVVLAHLTLLQQEGLLNSAATWSQYGTGLAGTLGVPQLLAQGNPVVGQTLSLDLTNSLGTSTVGLLFAGLSQTSLPAFGGTVLVQPLLTATFPVPAAGLALPVAVPADVSLLNLPVYFQALQADLGAPANISLSPGLQLTLGL